MIKTIEKVDLNTLKKGDIVYENYSNYSIKLECLGFRKTLGRWKFRDLRNDLEFTIESWAIRMTTEPKFPIKENK